MNVHAHPAPKRSTSESGSASVAGGGQPPYDEGMENRVVKLEDFAAESSKRFDRIDARLEQTVTKAELAKEIGELRAEMHRGFADVIKWMVGMTVLLGATGITVMTFVLNHGVPRMPVVHPAPQPIIIQLPPTATPPVTSVPTPPATASPNR